MQQTIITQSLPSGSGSETRHTVKAVPDNNNNNNNSNSSSVFEPPTDALVNWGRRHHASWALGVLSFSFMILCPVLVTFIWITLEYYDASVPASLAALKSEGLFLFSPQHLPRWSGAVTICHAAWVAFQAALYVFLPGKTCKGQLTPAGSVLDYKINGLLAWVATIFTAGAAATAGVLDPAIVARNWEQLICTLNICGVAVALIFYAKAHLFPSHARDRKFTGLFYDLYMGVELNPRIGKNFDMKLFQNGHLGMISWTVIDLSFAALQYQRFKYISNSMVIVNILQALYAVDFFLNEDWYLHTIDICHEHYGYYLAWGSNVFLPTTYTLQAQYLARYPVQLSPVVAATILLLGLAGYAIFRTVNHQKHVFRRTDGNCKIWGAEPRYIACVYRTADGAVHENRLLCSGGWGIVRHTNYVGDLLLSYAMCAVCGFDSLIPWSYAIFMTMVLVHRCQRDERRCLRKYGAAWERYCAQVRWKMVPGVY